MFEILHKNQCFDITCISYDISHLFLINNHRIKDENKNINNYFLCIMKLYEIKDQHYLIQVLCDS